MAFRRKSQAEIITGLDIGSTSIRVAAGQYHGDMDGNGELQIIGATEVPSEGIHKGVISSIDETVSSLTHALEQLERLIGVPVDHTWVGISGTHILSQGSRGVVAAAKPDGEITPEDVERAIDAARMVAPPLNHEVLHVLPKSFIVDGQDGIKNPVGMTGIRVEVDTQIIYGVSAHIKNITKAVYRTGIDIDDLVLSILAAGDVVTTPKQKELGCVVIDIGGSITSMVVYEGGDIIHTATFPIGSEHITNDLAIGLRTSVDVAGQVKLDFIDLGKRTFTKKDMLNLQDVGGEESEEVSLSYISEIADARVTEILEKVDSHLQTVGCSQLLPAGAVLTGGGARIGGLVDLTKDVLGLPAAVGYPINIQSISDKVNDVAFTTAIGLAHWGAQIYSQQGPKRRTSSSRTPGKFKEKLGEVWKSLIP
ncbi:MAG: cell division protein FtsA [Candidatus Magasanikbacteria bacterium]